MPPKADKLKQTIENLQLFLARRTDDREDLADIERKLVQFKKVLDIQKLTVQIVSDEPLLAQALFDLINSKKELKEVLQLKFDPIPKPVVKVTPKQFASIQLRQFQQNSTGVQQYFELSSDKEKLIGRSHECDIAIAPNLYQGVSWNHAAIEPVVNGEATQWQICDRGSTNGTFVNGRKITECQLLQSKDIVTLASPRFSEGIAELVFTTRVETPNSDGTDREYWDIVDCDLLFVVIDGKQAPTTEVTAFIRDLDNTCISKQFLVVDIPNPKQEPEVAKNADANLSELENWLKNEVADKGFELIPLYLKPYYSEDTDLEIDPKLQKKQDRFFKVVESSVKRQPENMLAKRIAVKVVRAAEPIEPVLYHQQEELIQKITQEQQEIKALEQLNFKEISKKAIAQANQDKDKFFKQIKLDVANSKAALLDIYSKKSIIYKVQDFVDRLNPIVFNKHGQKIIQLNDDSQPDSEDINESLIGFCTTSLESWAIEEWQRIQHIYDRGGLNSLLDRLYQTVNIVPNLLPESIFSQPERIDIKDNFLISFAGTNCEVSHKQKSLGAYIMKQLRSQMMQVMMMLTLLLGFVGISANKGQMMKNLSGMFQEQPWFFGIFVCAIIFLLVNAYNNDNKHKLEEAGTKLKKDLASYYQSFTKNLLDKVIQDINLALDSEDKKIADTLEFISDTYTDRIVEVEKQQIQIKNNLEKYQAQQKILSNELSEFEELKKM
ncbi:FHA domain-containing protein [Myxosarcina sp. GI1]|uniref:FHA domain-containing protein n=1 Tax=Myxosarcina sp. GI1 TaxID=1541065 RepID=UPI000568CC3E|nr:FHA domain-containing protein [Myxosarcina sp. GI1]